MHNIQTNKQNKTKQISKLRCAINLDYSSYFTLLLTSLLAMQKLVDSSLTFEIGYKFMQILHAAKTRRRLR